MSFTVIIPARFASSRFPGKVLTDIAGKSMLRRVYEQAQASDAAQVVIATDHTKVQQAAQAFGATVCMTAPTLDSGSDRAAEAAQQLGLADDMLLVNVQCDQPLIEPDLINRAAHSLSQHPQAAVATLATPIRRASVLQDPDVVKVVLNQQQQALYFSRAAIPYRRACSLGVEMPSDELSRSYLRHIGIYAYRVQALQQFVQAADCSLEHDEKLEQLRMLYHAQRIQVEVVEYAQTLSVDKPEDVAKILAILSAS